MAFTQLDPTIPVSVIGKGDGYAVAVIDYGQEHNLIWVTALNETGEIWCAPNPLVRMQGNWTMRREKPAMGVGSRDANQMKPLRQATQMSG